MGRTVRTFCTASASSFSLVEIEAEAEAEAEAKLEPETPNVESCQSAGLCPTVTRTIYLVVVTKTTHQVVMTRKCPVATMTTMTHPPPKTRDDEREAAR